MLSIFPQKILLFTIFFFVCIVFVSGCDQKNTNESTALNESKKPIVTELKIIDSALGDGDSVQKLNTVAVHYSGWLFDNNKVDKKGVLFDTSSDLGEPLVFVVGKRQVIKGWDQGIIGMKVGGKRTLIIPANMAYGSKRIGTPRTAIPENSALVFDVKLMQVN